MEPIQMAVIIQDDRYFIGCTDIICKWLHWKGTHWAFRQVGTVLVQTALVLIGQHSGLTYVLPSPGPRKT